MSRGTYRARFRGTSGTPDPRNHAVLAQPCGAIWAHLAPNVPANRQISPREVPVRYARREHANPQTMATTATELHEHYSLNSFQSAGIRVTSMTSPEGLSAT
jgi:hypothetical protein